MARNRKRLKGVPAAVETRQFLEVFNGFVENVANVHGREVAATYRTLREQEAAAVLQSASEQQGNGGRVNYPDASEQLQDFLSFRIDNQ